MSERVHREGEDGFTLVEMLVALVLMAGLVSAVGGILAYATKIDERSRTAERIGEALVKISHTMRNQLDRALAGHAEITISADLDRITFHRRSDDSTLATISLDGQELTLDAADLRTTVDLTAFGDPSLEVLSEGNPGWHEHLPRDTETLLSTRLMLKAEGLHFPVVFWAH